MATMVVMELFDTLRKSTHNFLFIICLVNSFSVLINISVILIVF